MGGGVDLVRKRVLLAAEGKDHQVWPGLVPALEKHNGHRHAITQVSRDMSPAYQKGVRETCRHAQVGFDQFHGLMKVNQAVDQVRRAAVRMGGPGGWAALHQSQWLWRKNPENLTEKAPARRAGIDQKSLRTAKAYQMRLVLQDISRSPTATVARHPLRVWVRWVRWVARQVPKNVLCSRVKVAERIEKHLSGILAHGKWGATNAFLEGLNSVFSATKRKARAVAWRWRVGLAGAGGLFAARQLWGHGVCRSSWCLLFRSFLVVWGVSPTTGGSAFGTPVRNPRSRRRADTARAQSESHTD